MSPAITQRGQLAEFAANTLDGLHTLVLRLDLPPTLPGQPPHCTVAVAHMAFGRGDAGLRARRDVLASLHCGLHYTVHAGGAAVHGHTLYLTGVQCVLPAYHDARVLRSAAAAAATGVAA